MVFPPKSENVEFIFAIHLPNSLDSYISLSMLK